MSGKKLVWLVILLGFILGFSANVEAEWYDPDWGYRKKITIDHTKVDTDLTNFAVLFSVTDADLMNTGYGGYVAQSDGGDILFTTYNGTKLDHEIENYNPSTGELAAWVKVDSLSSSTNTILYIYYGGPSTPDQWNINGTWESSLKMVQHLEETPANGEAGHIDSTSNNNTGTPYNFDGTSTSTTDGTGKINGADVFDGSDDYVNCGPGTHLTTWTISGWIKASSLEGTEFFGRYNLGEAGNWQQNYVVYKDTDHNICVQYKDTTDSWRSVISTTPLTVNNWIFVAGTFDSADTKLSIYINGTFENSAIYSPVKPTTDTLRIYIGKAFNGTIDEVRVYNRALSAEEISTLFNNQSSPSTFYDYGPPYPPKHVNLRVRDKAIDVTWEDNPDNPYPVDKYKIYYDTSSEWRYTYSLEVDGLYHWAELTDLTNTDTYFVSMTAVVSGVESDISYEKLINPAPADTTVTRTITGGTTSSAYTIISTPVEPEDNSISAVLEDDLGPYDNTQWRAFHWESDKGVYEEVTSSTIIGGHEGREPVVGGAGWLISRNDVTIDVTGCRYDHNNTRDYEIYLHPGWNMIGCPFNFKVAWSDVKATAERYPIYSANDSTNPLCGDIAWGWYDGAYCEVINLVPMHGCFVYNKISEPITLIVPHSEVEVSGEDYTRSQLKTDYNLKSVPSYKDEEPWKSPPDPPAVLLGETSSISTIFTGGGGGGSCFIATAAFGTPLAEELVTLRKFRDEVLIKSPAGREFVRFYYATSPPLADLIRNKPGLKAMVREALKPLIEFSK